MCSFLSGALSHLGRHKDQCILILGPLHASLHKTNMSESGRQSVSRCLTKLLCPILNQKTMLSQKTPWSCSETLFIISYAFLRLDWRDTITIELENVRKWYNWFWSSSTVPLAISIGESVSLVLSRVLDVSRYMLWASLPEISINVRPCEGK